MPKLTLGEICDAIASTLGEATGMQTAQSFEDLTEGLNAGDMPLLQVYWESLQMDPDGETDRSTYQGGIRMKRFVFHADVFARQRSHIGEDMLAMTNIVSNMIDVLEEQDTKPYFDLEGIKAFQLDSADRATFKYSEASYLGARFRLVIYIF